jgi:hypothetical protein
LYPRYLYKLGIANKELEKQMKRTILALLGLILCTLLMADSSFDEMMNAYEQFQDHIISFSNRMDYNYFITVYLPPGYSPVVFANENQYYEQIYYEWDTTWQQLIQYEFTYSNNLLTEYSMLMGGLAYHYDISYDADNRLYQSILSMDVGSGLQNYMRETFEYNANGVLNSYIAEYWQQDEWVNGVQWLMTLNGDQIQTILSQEWDQGWVNDERVNLTWDGDNVTENLREEWVDDNWVNDRLRDYSYENGNIVEIFEQIWNGSGWENSQLIELTWENSVTTYQLYKVWDGSNWVDDIQYTTTFENGKPIEDLALEWTGTEWVNDHKIEYLYNTGSLPIEIPKTVIQLSNYPNPFNPETTISFSIKENETGTLTIFNVLGERILREEFDAGFHKYTWNADGLASGVYFYKLTSSTTNMTRKMIMMK